MTTAILPVIVRSSAVRYSRTVQALLATRMRWMRALSCLLSVVLSARGQAQEGVREPVRLAVEAGSTLRIAVPERIRVRRAGQAIVGRVAEAVYAYDRVVIPEGTLVRGHLERLVPVSKKTRIQGIISGDFSPPRSVVVRFDTLVFVKGEGKHDAEEASANAASGPGDRGEMRIDSETTSAIESPAVLEEGGQGGQTKGRVAQKASDLKRSVRDMARPGKLQRIKWGVVARLPFHPQYLPPATIYTATLRSAVDFGLVVPLEMAPAGTRPPPDSILTARLTTPLHSRHTPRGAPLEAILTKPLLNERNEIILPEGARLVGGVTFVKAAQSFRRNGELRFLVERVEAPARTAQVTAPASETLLASLHSVEAAAGDRITLDDEGGVRVTNSKTRFLAPALSGIAFGLTVTKGLDYNTDGGPPEASNGLAQSNGAGGFLGLGFLGVGLAQISRPFSIAVGAYGALRSGYGGLVAKGRDVSFPTGTLITLRLSPAPVETK